MKRFLLLLLIVLIIVAGLAWVTSEPVRTHAPFPVGPGELASSGLRAAAAAPVVLMPAAT